MLAPFLLALRHAGVPATITEHLFLLDALRARAADATPEGFYYLARAALVKDERHLDRFDQVFATHFHGALAPAAGPDARTIPDEWLRKLAENTLSPEEMAQLESLGWDQLMETLRQRLAEQQGRHQGGSKWIGTAGTSPFGAYGSNPVGVRIGQDGSRHRRAVKVWDQREFRDLDDDAALSSRGMKLALRRLRRFARTGATTELDIAGTIAVTARKNILDIQMVPERHNAVRVCLLLDTGGSMDDHVRQCEDLFAAAKTEFRHLTTYYFHNCPYETLWIENRRRTQTSVPTHDILRTLPVTTKLVLVGDASMSPYELIQPGGSVEHVNAETGEAWLRRILAHFRAAAWLNPVDPAGWDHTHSVRIVRDVMEDRMFPMTLSGIDAMIRVLAR